MPPPLAPPQSNRHEARVGAGIEQKARSEGWLALAPESVSRPKIADGGDDERPESHDALCFPMEILPSQNWFATQAVTTETIRS